MGLVAHALAGLFGGVSQQAPSMRLDTQCEVSENCYPSIAHGVEKRPPTEFVAVLGAGGAAKRKVHLIDRGSGNEHYEVVFKDDTEEPLEIYDLSGTKKTLTYDSPASKTYAYSASPLDDMKVVTIADHSLIANKSVLPAMSSTVEPLWYPLALINVLRGVAGTIYTVTINGHVVSYTSGDTTAYATYRTTVIASALFDGLAAWQLGLTVEEGRDDFQLVYSGSSILIFNTANTDFTFGVSDSWGNAALAGVKEQASKLEDLPARLADSASYATDVFSLNYQAEYEMNVLLAEDPAAPGTFVELGAVVSGYGHEDSSTAESMVYWKAVVEQALIAQRVITSGTNWTLRDSTSADFWHSDTWQVSLESPTVLSVWRTDGVRVKLYAARRHYRDGVLGALVWTPSYFTTSRHEVVNFTGMAVKVYGGLKADFTGYYLKWKTEMDNQRHATGTWVETRVGGISQAFDADTMPHKLVRNANGTFTFAVIAWEERKVGDLDTAPEPSFIGAPIEDIFFYRNRLGMVAGQAYSLSVAGDFYNFFPATAMDVLDDDPIDSTAPTSQVSILHHALPFNKNLLMFSDEVQLQLGSGDNMMTPKTGSCDVITRYAAYPGCHPVSAGSNVYFPTPKGSCSAIQEYFVSPDTYNPDAADITAHADSYLPAALRWLAVSSSFNVLVAATGDSTEIYTYHYYWSGDQKVQSAWGKWIINGTILHGGFIENYLYLVMERDGEISLERINMQRVAAANFAFRVHLDRQAILTGVYSGGVTTWTLPYEDDAADFMAVRADTGLPVPGITHPLADTLTAAGDFSGTTCIIGRPYTQKFRFSEWGMKDTEGKTYNYQGRLQTRTITVSFKNTGYFKVTVQPVGRSPLIHEYTAVDVGSVALGHASVVTGTKRFSVKGNAKTTTVELSNDSYLPSQFVGASWEGEYSNRNQLV